MRILSREHFERGIIIKAIFHCGLMFIGIIMLQAWPNEGISQSNSTGLHPYEPVGCFRDAKYPRALPILVRKYPINYSELATSLAAIIQACAAKVYEYGFWYFGVEYRHECWSGATGDKTYNIHGLSDNCLWNYSVGDRWTIFVYRFVEG